MTINWENNIVIWAPPFRNKIKCWLHASWKMFLQLNPLLWQCRSRYYSCRARPWVVGLRLGSLCSLFWPITTHLAALHKLCDTSSMDRKFENIGSIMVLAVATELLLTIKNGKAIVSLIWHCWSNPIWSDPHFFHSNTTLSFRFNAMNLEKKWFVKFLVLSQRW